MRYANSSLHRVIVERWKVEESFMADSKFSCFCLGLGIGAAVGLLFAPKPGDATREELRLRAEESREFLKRRSGELRQQAEEVLDRGRSTVHSQREQLSAALEAGRRAYREATAGGADSAPDSAPPA
jgi:gas vesicle protein